MIRGLKLIADLYQVQKLMGGGLVRLHFTRGGQRFIIQENVNKYIVWREKRKGVYDKQYFTEPQDIKDWLERMEEVQT